MIVLRKKTTAPESDFYDLLSYGGRLEYACDSLGYDTSEVFNDESNYYKYKESVDAEIKENILQTSQQLLLSLNKGFAIQHHYNLYFCITGSNNLRGTTFSLMGYCAHSLGKFISW